MDELRRRVLHRRVSVDKSALLWALIATILLGLSCFLIGLTSYDDILDFGPTSPKFVWTKRLTEDATHLDTSVSFHASYLTLRSDDLLSSNTTDARIMICQNSPSCEYRLWWWRVTLDLSLLWLTNGFIGLIVGAYLISRFGGILLPSASMDVVLPRRRTSFINFGSLFRNEVVRRGTRLFGFDNNGFDNTDDNESNPHATNQCDVKVGDKSCGVIKDGALSDEVIFMDSHRGAIRALDDEETDRYIRDFDIVTQDDLTPKFYKSVPHPERAPDSFGSISEAPMDDDGSSIDYKQVDRVNSRSHIPNIIAMDNADEMDKLVVENRNQPDGMSQLYYEKESSPDYQNIEQDEINISDPVRDLDVPDDQIIEFPDNSAAEFASDPLSSTNRFMPSLAPVLGGLGLAASQAALKVGFWCPPDQWAPITAVSNYYLL